MANKKEELEENNKTNKKAESKLLKKFNNLGSFLCEKWKKLFSNLAIFKSLEYNNTIKQRGDENVTIYQNARTRKWLCIYGCNKSKNRK